VGFFVVGGLFFVFGGGGGVAGCACVCVCACVRQICSRACSAINERGREGARERVI